MALLMEVIRARRGDDLDAIRRRLHDVWLQLPDTLGPGVVTLEGRDERSSRLPIRSFGRLTQFERRAGRVVLVIESVVEGKLVDHAETGSLNVASIWFDEDSSTVCIEGHIPVELRLHVEELDVRAEITDDVVVSSRTWGLRRGSA